MAYYWLQLVEKLGEHLKGKDKEKEKDIKHGIIRGFVELNEQVSRSCPPSSFPS
jgi:hypothetical protein